MNRTTSSRRKRWFFFRSLARAYQEWLESRQRKQSVALQRPLFAEVLEPRVLFSGAPVEPPPEPEQGSEQTSQNAPATLSDGQASGGSVGQLDFEGAIISAAEDGEVDIELPEEVSLNEVDEDALTVVGSGNGGSVLDEEALQAIVEAARQRWIDSGITSEQLAVLDSVTYEIADFGGDYLGKANGLFIALDDDAAGTGAWFIDATPHLDEEFRGDDPFGLIASLGPAAQRFDLLTVVMHEQGHLLGLDDEFEGLMAEFLGHGIRRNPLEGQAAGVVPESVATPQFLTVSGTPLQVGFSPDGSLNDPNTGVGLRLNGVEYLYPGSPVATFTVAVNGSNYTNASPSGGSQIPVTISDLSSGSTYRVQVTGTVGGVLGMVRTVSWRDGDSFLTIDVSLTNLTEVTLNGVAFLENWDPDPGNIYGTANDVRLDGKLILASSANGAVGMGSEDPRAVASAEGFFVTNPFEIINSPVDPNGAIADIAINLAFNIGTLAPGETTSFSSGAGLGTTPGAAEAAYEAYLSSLLTTNISVDASGNLIIEDVDGANTNDDLTIVIVGTGPTATYRITDSANSIDESVLVSSVTGTIIVNTLGGNDTLTIDFSGGPITRPITYNGGTGGNDDLVLVGGTFATATYNFTNEHDGSIQLTGQGLITYTGLEPITSTITAADVTLNYGAASETITITNAGSGRTRVDSTAGEVVTFNHPTQSLTINTGDGNDTINLHGLGGDFAASLIINGQGGTTDSITVSGAISTNGGDISLSASGDITVSGAILSGGGDLTIAADSDANGVGSYFQTPSVGGVLPSGAILHWAMNESPAMNGAVIVDDSGLGNHGSLSNDAGSASTTGQFGGGLDFGGNNETDYVFTNPVSHWPTTELTISLWLKTTQAPNNKFFFSYAVPGQDNEILISQDLFYLKGTTVSGNLGINDGNFHHVVFTWQSSDGAVTAYVDGIQKYSGTAQAGATITGGGSLFLGQDQDVVEGGLNATQAYAGVMDDLAVFDRALSLSEIAGFYLDGLYAGAGNVSVTAADAVINGQISGTGTLTIAPSAANGTIGIGGGAGSLNLSDTDLGNLADGFSSITIGRVSDGSGAVDVDSSVFSDNVTIAGGSIAVTELNAGTNGVTLTARTGNITDGGGTTDVTAASLVATAASGVGSAANSLETAIKNIEGRGGNGGFYLTNAGGLVIGGIDVMTGISVIGGNINITAAGTLKADEDIVNSGGEEILLQALAELSEVVGQSFIASSNFTIPTGVTSVMVLAIGGGGGGANGHQGGGGAGYVHIETIMVTPGFLVPITVGIGGDGALDSASNSIIGLTAGTASSFGMFLIANGGGVVSGVNQGGHNGSSGGGAAANAGNLGGNGGSGGSNGQPAQNGSSMPIGLGQGNYLPSLALFTANLITAGAGGAAGTGTHAGGGGGGGIFINGGGPSADSGNAVFSAGGGAGYGAGGGAGGLNFDINAIRYGGGDGADGLVYVEYLGANNLSDLILNANVTATGGNGNITLNAANDILQNSGTVSAAGSGAVDLNASTGTSDGVITQADGTLITSESGAITLDADGDITVNAISTSGTVGITPATGEIRDRNNNAPEITGSAVTLGGTVAPGFSPGLFPGTLSVAGNTTLSGDVNFDINGANADLLDVNGTVTLGGTLTIAGTGPTAALYTVIDNDGTADAVSGVFSNLNADGAAIQIDGVDYKIFYRGGDGNDVVLANATPPTVVYVDDSWSAFTGGMVITDADLGTTASEGAIFKINAFSTLADAIAAVGAGGTIIVNGGTYAETVSLDNSQIMEITGPNAAGTVTINALSSTSGTNIIIEGSSTLTVGDDDTDQTIAGVISGSGGLAKIGAGVLTLSGANTYTGTTTISDGILKLGVNSALGSTTGKTVINGGTLDINGKQSLTELIEVEGAGYLGQGAITNTGGQQTSALNNVRLTGDATFGSPNLRWDIYGTMDMAGYTLTKVGVNFLYLKTLTINNPGSVDIKAGTFVLENTTDFDGTGTITVRTGATLLLNKSEASGQAPITHNVGLVLEHDSTVRAGTFVDRTVSPTIAGNVTLVSGTATITTATGSGTSRSNLTLSGNITGAGGIRKNGTEILTLSGNNNYAGATIVEAGTLLINGDNSGATGTVNVANGADFGGTGTVGGIVTIVTGADLQPGNNGIGTLTISSNTIINGDLEFDINGGTTDLLRVNGNGTAGDDVTLSGTSTVTFNVASNPTASLITVIDNDGTADTISTVFSNHAEGTTVTLGTRTYKIFYKGGDGNDVVLADATTPTVVYVDDSWSALTGGMVIADADLGTTNNQGAIFGVNAFTTITDALAAVSTSGTIIVNGGTYAEAVSLTSTRTLEITGPDAAQTVTINSLATVAGTTVNLEGSSTLVFGDATSTALAGQIIGSGSLTKNGTGTVTISGDNSYSGITTINRGTVAIQHANALGATGPGSKTIVNGNDGATSTALLVNTSTPLVINETFEFKANSSGRVTLNTNSSAVHTFAGPIDVSSTGNLVQFSSNGTGGMTVTGDISGTMTGSLLFLRGGSSNTANHIQGSLNLTGSNLAKTDTGLWIVGSAGESYSWVNTQVAVGTVRMGTDGVLPATGTVSLGQNDTNHATLDLNGTNQTTTGITFSFAGTSVSSTGSLTTGTGTLTLNGNVTYNTVNTYTGPGGSLTGNLNLGGGTRTFTINDSTGASTELTISANIRNGSLTKAGAGNLLLSGTNTHTGATTVNAGILTLSGGSAIADTGAVVLANTAGAILNLLDSESIGSLAGGGISGGNVTLGSNTLTTGGDHTTTAFAGIVSGAGGLTKLGNGTFTMSGANSYNGDTTITAGVVKLGDNSALGNEVGKTVINGGTLDIGGFRAGANGNELVEVQGTGAGGVGAIINSGGGQTNAFRRITLTGDATFRADNRWDMRNAGGASTFDMGGFTLTKVGTREFSIVNTTISNPGSVNATQGIFRLEGTSDFDGTGTITVSSGANLDFWSSNQTHEVDVVLEGGAILTSSSSDSYATTLNGTVTLSGVAGVGANQVTETNQRDLVISGNIVGVGGISKIGVKSLTVSGTNNTYSGTTSVSGGTLQLNGSHTGGGTYTVGSGATLSGTGATTAAVTVNSGGFLSPGLISGDTTDDFASSNLVLSAGSTYAVQLDSTTANTGYDQVDVTGTVTLGGTLQLTSGFTPIAGDTFIIINNDGTADAVSGTFSGFVEGSTVTAGGQNFVISYAGGDGNDVVLFAGAAETNVDLTGGVLTISDIGSETADAITISFDGTYYNISDPNAVISTTGLGGINVIRPDARTVRVLASAVTGITVTTANPTAGGAVDSVTINSLPASLAGAISVSAETINLNTGVTTGGAQTYNGNVVLGTPTLLQATTLTINGPVSLGVNTLTLDVSTATSAINGAVGGTGGLVKQGAGRLDLAGSTANTYNGVTTVSAGQLHLNNSGGNAVGGNLDITTGGKVTFGRNNQIIDTATVTMSSAGSVFNGTAANVGTFNVTETIASLTVSGGAFNASAGGNWTVTGAGSFTGSADPGGTVFVGNSGTSISFGSLGVTGMTGVAGAVDAPNSFTLYGNSGTRISQIIVGSGGLTLDNSVFNLRSGILGSQLILTGNITTAGTSPSTIQNGGGGAGVVELRLVGGNIVDTGAAANLTISTSIVDHTATPASLTKTGAGQLSFTGSLANSYSGLTSVNQGVLHLSQTAGVVSVAGNLSIAGGFVTFGANEQIANTSAVTMGSGALNGVGSNLSARGNHIETIASLSVTGGAVNTGSGSQWTISGAGSFTGSAIPGGTIFVGASGAAGAVTTFGSLSLTNMNGGGGITSSNTFGVGGTQFTTVVVGGGGLTLDNSNLRLSRGTGGSRLVLEGNLATLGTSGSRVDAYAGGSGPATLELAGAAAGAVTRTLDIGGGGANLTVDLVVTNGGATPASVLKAGTGTLTLTGANTYSGLTTISTGTLALTGTGEIDESIEIAIAAGATFSVSGRTGGGYSYAGEVSGTGAVTGNLTVLAGGDIQPGNNLGNDIGTLTVTGNTALSGTFAHQINGGTSADLLTANGTVNLTGATLTVEETTAGAPPVGITILLIANDDIDAVTGTFNGFPEGAIVTDDDGNKYVISYVGGTGNDVVLFAGAAETNVDLTGGVLAISDIGSETADAITISFDGTYYNISDPNAVISTTGLGGINVIRPDARTVRVLASAVTGITVTTANPTAGGAVDSVTINSLPASLAGAISVSAETINLNTGVTTGGAQTYNGNVVLGTPTHLQATTLTINGPVSLGANTLTVDVSTGTSAINGAVGGTGGLVKQGAGRLDLAGSTANTYNGETTVSAGQLHLNNSGGNAVGGNLDITTGGKVTFGRNNQIIDTAAVTMSSAGSVLNGTGVNGGQFSVTETIASLTVSGGAFNASAGGNWTITGAGSFIGGAGNTIFVGNSGTRIAFGSLALTGMTATAGGNVAAVNTFTLYGNSTVQSTLTVGSGGLSLDNSRLNLRRGGAGTNGSKLVLNGEVTTFGTAASFIMEDTAGGTSGVATMELSGIAGAVTRTFNIGAGGADLTVSTAISNGAGTPASLIKTGTGQLSLTGGLENTYSGTTTINGGTLRLGQTSGVTSVAGNILVNVGGTLTLSTNEQIADTAGITVAGGTITGWSTDETIAFYTQNAGGLLSSGNIGHVVVNGTLTLAGGNTLVINSNASANPPSWTVGSAVLTGADILLGGNNGAGNPTTKLVIGSGGLTMSGRTITLNQGNAGTELFLNGDFTGTGTNRIETGVAGGLNPKLVIGNATRSFAVNSGTTTIGMEIAGVGGAITKTGTGTLTLTGANTYTGSTTVNTGTLLVNGNHTGAVAYTVASGATLGGTGSTTAAVTVGSGGFLNPGLASGDTTDDFGSGTLLLGTGSTYSVRLDSTAVDTGYDQVDVSGTVTLGGNLQLTAGFAPAAGDTFIIINNDGTADAVTGTFSGFVEGSTIPVGGQDFVVSYVGGDGNDVVLFAGTPDTNVDLSGGVLTISDINSETADAISISFDGTYYVITDPNAVFSTTNLSGGNVTRPDARTVRVLASEVTSLNVFTSGVGVAADTVTINSLPANIGGAVTISAETINLNADVTTTGPQTYDGNTTLGADVTLTSSGGGDIDLLGTINGAFALNVNTAGDTSFAGIVGGTTALASLATDAAGTTTVNTSAITTTGNQTFADNLSILTGTTLTAANVNATGASVDLVTGTLAVNVTGSGSSITGAISGGGSLTKEGNGTLVLTEVNDYSGTTTVNGGILLVNSSHTGADDYTVGAAGTLGGSGTITLASGKSLAVSGSLAPGNAGVGTLAVIGDVRLVPGSKFLADLDGTANSSDLFTVDGDLDLTGGRLFFNEVTTADDFSYTLITVTGTLTGVPSVDVIPAGYAVDYNLPGQVRLLRPTVTETGGADTGESVTLGGFVSSVITDVTPAGGAPATVAAGSTSTGNPTTVAGIYGDLVIGADGSFLYSLVDSRVDRLSQGEVATDTFNYTFAFPGSGGPGSITFIVNGTNDIPILQPDDGTVFEGGVGGPSVLISNALGNDSDVDQLDVLNVTNLTFDGVPFVGSANGGGAIHPGAPTLTDGLYGTLRINADGSFLYTLGSSLPETRALVEGQVVVETFTYTVSDGKGGLVTEKIRITVIGAAGGQIGEFQGIGGSQILESFRFSEPGGLFFGDDGDGERNLPLLTLMPTYSGTAAPGTVLTIRIVSYDGAFLPGGCVTVVTDFSGNWSALFSDLILTDSPYYLLVEEQAPSWDQNAASVFHTYFAPAISGSYNASDVLSVNSILGRRLSSVAMEMIFETNLHPRGSNEDWRSGAGFSGIQ